MITLVINGQTRRLERSVTLAEYLHSLGLDDRYVAAAYNGAVVSREEFNKVALAEGDQVEIVRPVGGG